MILTYSVIIILHFYFIIIFIITLFTYPINIFCYHNITLLLYHNILLSHYSIIILKYSVIIILHDYFIIIFYYHISQLLLLQIWVNISNNSKHISKKQCFLNKHALFIWGPCFLLGKKPLRAPAGLAKGVGAIQSPSVA